MYFDSKAWPPPPDGSEPEPPKPRLTPAQERRIMWVVTILLLVVFLGPFAGSSVIEAIVALIRAAGVHG